LASTSHYDGIVIPNEARKEFRNTIDFEAFAPGEWNGLKFDRTDIEEIAKNFSALLPYHKVPLKFGHNDDQPFTDGQPALGWVIKAWVSDTGKLMLRAEKVPDVVKRAIGSGLYRKVSVELDIGVEHKGKYYRYVLSGVALLGADLPAVNSLADLDHYIDKPTLVASKRGSFSAISGQKEKESFTMDEATKKAIGEAVQAAVAPLTENLTKAQAEIKRLSDDNLKLTRERDDADKKAQGEKVKAARDTVNAKLEAAVKQSVILPAQREYFIAQGVNDDIKVLTLDVDAYITNVSGGKKFDFAKDTAKEKTGERVHEDPALEVSRLMHIEMGKDKSLDASKARMRVLKANPALANEYAPEPA
jgi:hypothetical protein